jgi:hypothetical protein
MQQLRVPAGSQVYLGAPAVPMESEIVAALAELVDSASEVTEAHLPQTFVPGVMPAPAQVLVIVTLDADRQLALNKIGPGLGRILPAGRSIDVWPLSPSDHLLSAVRGANCRIGQHPGRAGLLGRLRR